MPIISEERLKELLTEDETMDQLNLTITFFADDIKTYNLDEYVEFKKMSFQ